MNITISFNNLHIGKYIFRRENCNIVSGRARSMTPALFLLEFSKDEDGDSTAVKLALRSMSMLLQCWNTPQYCNIFSKLWLFSWVSCARHVQKSTVNSELTSKVMVIFGCQKRIGDLWKSWKDLLREWFTKIVEVKHVYGALGRVRKPSGLAGLTPGGRVPEERPAGCAAVGRSVTAVPARRALADALRFTPCRYCFDTSYVYLLPWYMPCPQYELVTWSSSFQTSGFLSVDCDRLCVR